MPNPPLLICDSDALVQIFIAQDLTPIRNLKSSYGIQAAVVEEVEGELRWLGKFKDRFVPQFEKSVKNGTLQVLGPKLFQTLLASAPAKASWTEFQSRGAQYYKHVGKGEAYTFAAAVTLELPALSNDFNAIQTLTSQGFQLPSPVLRLFDLIVCAYRCGAMNANDCDSVRQSLARLNEGLPSAFVNKSFVDGIPAFACRIGESSGISIQASTASYDSTMYLNPKK